MENSIHVVGEMGRTGAPAEKPSLDWKLKKMLTGPS